MGRYNEILVGRFNRALQKLIGTKGEVPSPQFSTEVIPVIPMPLGSEFRYLEGWDTYARTIGQASGAANTFNALMLRNPVGSNVVGVVIRATASAANIASTIRLLHAGGNAGDLGTLLNVVGGNERLDARSRPVGSLILSAQNNVGGAFSGSIFIEQFDLPAVPAIVQFITHPLHEITLLPGDTLELLNATATAATTMTLWWRERYLEESERT